MTLLDWMPLKDAAIAALDAGAAEHFCRGATNHCKRSVTFSNGWFEIKGDRSLNENEWIATFRIEEDITTTGLGPLTSAATTAIMSAQIYLRQMIEKNLRNKLRTEQLSISAKVRDPISPLAVIPNDSFEDFRLVDWLRGSAQASDGSWLYAIALRGAKVEGAAITVGESSAAQNKKRAIGAVAPKQPLSLVSDARRGRGRIGDKTVQIAELMKKMPPDELIRMKGEEMAATFKAARSTCEKARQMALPSIADK